MNAPVPYHHAELIPFKDLEQMADAVARSGLFGMKEKTQALALMLTAQAEGQHPATITQDYDIIQGKACRKTHSVLARFQQAGGKVEWHELTEARAKATFSHPAGGALVMEWTIDMAKRAGLTDKDNWRRYPRAMLRARCIAEGVRAVYPAAIGGYLVPEEAQDLDAIPGEVTSRTVEPAGPQAKADPVATETTAPAGAAAATLGDAGADGAGGAPGESKGDLLSPGARQTLERQMAKAGRTEADLMAAGYPSIEKMTFQEHFQKVIDWLKSNPAAK